MIRPKISIESLPERHARRRRVICGSMFHREMDILDWRIHELAEVVDDFVVIEATRTHSGLVREPVHPFRDGRFAGLQHRLHSVVLDDPTEYDDPWIRERGQREALWPLGIEPLGPGDDTLVIISDVDEVPYPEVVDRLARSDFEVPLYARPHWFNFNWNNYLGPWDHASIVFYTAGMLDSLYTNGRGADVGIAGVAGYELEGIHGWHASWFGPDHMILDKLSSYVHAPEERDKTLLKQGSKGINKRRRKGYDLFGTRKRQKISPSLPKYGHKAVGEL